MINSRFLADYFGFVFRLVVWFVLSVIIFFFAYCTVLLVGEAFQYVNANWVEADEEMNYLIFTCVAVFIVGLVSSWTRRRGRG